MNDEIYNKPGNNRIKSPKSAELVYLLCLLLGGLGIHRFFVGKYVTGFLMLITAGGLGLWVLVDLMFITNNKFEDKQKRVIILTKQPSVLKRSLIVISTIIAWLVISIATFIGIVFYLTSGMVDVARLQLSAIKAGENKLAYSYTSKEFQKAIPYNQFERFISLYPVLKNTTETSFTQRQIENNGGLIAGVLKTKEGKEVPVEYRFIKENSEWKIISINIKTEGNTD
ncbi:DUF4864 domain-containing protein [Legionella impletisoli]|uniref:TM2 domain-containing protein n=1 Tax=Legionella impletisoli TaxID=343510 RepID=A0A917JSY9_9GAMM|nr:DUF4864 domain-containing protein [Legionella impletisoli]GGI82276.1 hypothetical protein GCM10007966_08530 [Legionella impletisoli]